MSLFEYLKASGYSPEFITLILRFVLAFKPFVQGSITVHLLYVLTISLERKTNRGNYERKYVHRRVNAPVG